MCLAKILSTISKTIGFMIKKKKNIRLKLAFVYVTQRITTVNSMKMNLFSISFVDLSRSLDSIRLIRTLLGWGITSLIWIVVQNVNKIFNDLPSEYLFVRHAHLLYMQRNAFTCSI